MQYEWFARLDSNCMFVHGVVGCSSLSRLAWLKLSGFFLFDWAWFDWSLYIPYLPCVFGNRKKKTVLDSFSLNFWRLVAAHNSPWPVLAKDALAHKPLDALSSHSVTLESREWPVFLCRVFDSMYCDKDKIPLVHPIKEMGFQVFSNSCTSLLFHGVQP